MPTSPCKLFYILRGRGVDQRPEVYPALEKGKKRRSHGMLPLAACSTHLHSWIHTYILLTIGRWVDTRGPAMLNTVIQVARSMIR